MVEQTLTELRGSTKEHDVYNVLSYVCNDEADKKYYQSYRQEYPARLVVKACNYMKDDHEEKLEQLIYKRDTT